MSILNFALALILLYAVWVATIRIGMKKLTCSREFSRKRVFEGERGELVETVRNDTPFIIPWLRVESYISPHLQIGKQDNLHVSAEMYYCSVFTMMPYQQIRRTHQVKFARRGAYDLGNAALTCGDLLGLTDVMRSQKLSTPVLVYPRLMDTDEIPMPVSRMLGELVRRQQLLQDPFLVRGIRAYQPGDPVRDIHWPATARIGETQVRVRDYSSRSRLLVVLNVQQEDMQLNKYVPETQEQWVEEAIRMCATVCIQALRSGFSAGIAANMPMGDSQESTVILPADGAAREEELLASCARLKLECTQRFPVFLETLEKHTGLDILVISRYEGDSIRQSLQKLTIAGNQVTFHLMEGGSL